MKQYRCHKIVSAMLIAAVHHDMSGGGALDSHAAEGAPLNGAEPCDAVRVGVSAAYMLKHRPQAGGYYVKYEDGYESFSPAATFEAGYTLLPALMPPPHAAGLRELHGHKVNPANDVLTITVDDAVGAGGAQHRYTIGGFNSQNNPSCPHVSVTADRSQPLKLDPLCILFQNGPIPKAGVNGVTHEALLAVLIDRLEAFQSGAYACAENNAALNSLLEAQTALHSRTLARMARNVEGTHTV